MMKRNMDVDEVKGIGGKRYCPEKVSRVLHIRNVPNEVNERDIANLAIPFGPIVYFVLTRKTGQALMELQHEESASAMIEYYNECPPQLGSKNIVLQYSRFETLSGAGMHHDAEAAVLAANEDVTKLCQEEPHLVLHVTVESWNGTRLGHLHFFKLLHRFGNILRIIVFVQNQNPQALVEFENETSAHVAKLQLDISNSFYGRPIKIEFSKKKSLEIKHESDTGRDYTISAVSREELNSIPNFQQVQTHSNDNHERRHDYSIMRSNNNNQQYTAAEALQLLQPFLQAANNNPNEALPMLHNLAPTLSSLLSQSHSNVPAFGNNRMTNNRTNEIFQRSPVLIIANLNEDRVTPDALFVLFGAYGDILRVKILYNKKHTALIQFIDADNAERAIINLNNVSLYGKQMRVNYSKHASISMPKPDEQNSVHLNKDYGNSRLHRFKNATLRTMTNIFPPGVVLHIAGLPENYENHDIRKILEEEGFPFVKIKIITSNNRKMALVQMTNVDVAIEALIRLHDFNLGKTKLRVSFSKGFIAN